MAQFSLNINGKARTVEADPTMPLLWVLRDLLDLTGTKYSCGMGQCGTCTVHLNGAPIRSCMFLISGAANQSITTIEGLSENGDHPLQLAWKAVDVPQCGYCQPGQLMTAAALLKSNPNPSAEEIDANMTGNICRCGTYQRIRSAVQLAAKKGAVK